MVRVRCAQAEDWTEVARLFAHLRGPLDNEHMESAGDVYRRSLRQPSSHALVALVDGKIVAFCSLEFRERLGVPNPWEGWIPELVTDPTYRRQGAARALLVAAFEEARLRRCFRLILESGYGREAAHYLYPSVGMHDAGRYYIYRFSYPSDDAPRRS